MFKPIDTYLYAENLKKYGPDDSRTILEPAGLAEARRETAIDLLKEYHQIVDLGCGPGVFASRLFERSPHLQYYHGIDGVLEFVESAKARHMGNKAASFSHQEIEFVVLNKKIECVAALGVMSDLDPNKLDDFADLLTSLASRAIVFSFHDNSIYKGKLAAAFEISEVLQAFARHGWPNVSCYRAAPEDSLVICSVRR